MREIGSPPPSGFQDGSGRIGRVAAAAASSTVWRMAWARGESFAVVACEYAYPARSTHWKNSMHVVHTAAVPPNQGRIRRAMSGCTRNSRNEDRKIVVA